MEYPEAIIRALPRARKPHRCCECRREIAKGETYERTSGIWGGEPHRYKTCIPCADLRSDLDKERRERRDPWEDGIPFEGLLEYLIESDDPRLEKVRPDLWARLREAEAGRLKTRESLPPSFTPSDR